MRARCATYFTSISADAMRGSLDPKREVESPKSVRAGLHGPAHGKSRRDTDAQCAAHGLVFTRLPVWCQNCGMTLLRKHKGGCPSPFTPSIIDQLLYRRTQENYCLALGQELLRQPIDCVSSLGSPIGSESPSDVFLCEPDRNCHLLHPLRNLREFVPRIGPGRMRTATMMNQPPNQLLQGVEFISALISCRQASVGCARHGSFIACTFHRLPFSAGVLFHAARITPTIQNPGTFAWLL